MSPRRSGLTLAELLIAVTIMALLALAIGSLAAAVQMSNEYATGQGTATQHARVALERIERAVNRAWAAEDFPGCLVLAEYEGPWEFPDTLVVWHPDGTPVNPLGPPLMRELVIFCPDPTDPSRLLEITAPNDSRPAPPAENLNAWKEEIRAVKLSDDARRIELTNLLQTAAVRSSQDDGGALRAAVRFEVTVRPSPEEWSAYRNGDLAWNSLLWAQSIHGANAGLRQCWCRIELQLVPERRRSTSGQLPALPFFGSAAVYSSLPRNSESP